MAGGTFQFVAFEHGIALLTRDVRSFWLTLLQLSSDDDRAKLDHVLGVLIGQNKLIDIEAADDFRLQIEQCCNAKERHQHGKVDKQMITDERDRVHVSHNLGECCLLCDRLVAGYMRIEMYHAQEIQTHW